MSDAPLRVLVTGASGYIGRKLIQRLEGNPKVEEIIALDLQLIPPSFRCAYYQRDITLPIDDILREHSVNAVVHLAFQIRPSHNRQATWRTNVRGTEAVLKSCAQEGVKRFLYLSSTTVYGAYANNPDILTEESPIRPVHGFQYSEDKAEVEALLGRFSEEPTDNTVNVLRGCVVMGPSASNFVSQALSRSFLVALKGYDPPMQFLHENDLTDALITCLQSDSSGTYNVAGEGTVNWRDLTQMSGQRLITLPAPVIYGVTEATWRLRLQGESSAAGLNFIRYPWVASTEKMQRELGFKPRYTSREALAEFIEAKGR